MSSTYDEMIARHPILKVVEVRQVPICWTGDREVDLKMAEQNNSWDWQYKLECGHWFYSPDIKRVGDTGHCLVCRQEVGLEVR